MIIKICFVSSSGGHLDELLMLKPLAEKYDSYLLTEKTDYNAAKINISQYYVNQINRKENNFLIHFIKLFSVSFKLFKKERPDIIITTGALVAVPTCIIGKIFKKKIIFIESFADINSPTLSGRIVYKFADVFIVQWESMLKFYPKAIYGGSIY